MFDDDGLFGIDWDGDGKVTEEDDMMTMFILDEEERERHENYGSNQSCMLFLLMLPLHAIISLLEGLHIV